MELYNDEYFTIRIENDYYDEGELYNILLFNTDYSVINSSVKVDEDGLYTVYQVITDQYYFDNGFKNINNEPVTIIEVLENTNPVSKNIIIYDYIKACLEEKENLLYEGCKPTEQLKHQIRILESIIFIIETTLELDRIDKAIEYINKTKTCNWFCTNKYKEYDCGCK